MSVENLKRLGKRLSLYDDCDFAELGDDILKLVTVIEGDAEQLQERLRTAEQEVIDVRNHWSDLYAKSNDENKSLRQQIEASQKQDEVGRISMVCNQGAGHFFNVEWLDHCNFKEGDLLYSGAAPSQAAAIPEEINDPYADEYTRTFNKGWNSCIATWRAMLSAAPKP